MCSTLRVLNVVTGRLWSFAAPPGTAGWTPAGFNRVSAISPGGRMLAAYALTGAARQGRVRLYVVHLGGAGRIAVVPSSAVLLSAGLAWTVRGSWLLYQGSSGHLWAYQAATGRTRRFSTPCCQYTATVAARSRG